MIPTNPIGPPTDTAAPVASEAEKNAIALRAHHVHAARGGALGADAQQIQRPRQPREMRERDDDQRQRGRCGA
jgi:hypothetical protein